MTSTPTPDADPEGFATVTLEDLGVSLQIPLGWEAFLDAQQVTFQGEGDPVSGYLPTVTIRVGEPEAPGRDWWDEFTRGVVGLLEQTAPEFELRSQGGQQIPDGGETYFVTAFWDSSQPELPRTAQLQGWLWAGSFLMYQFSATSSAEQSDRNLPIFEAIFDSLRLLPLEVGTAGI